MLAKCHCNNCSAHLEFDPDSAGELIVCPKCGLETQLYIPTATAKRGATSRAQRRRYLKVALLTVLATVATLFGALVYAEKEVIKQLLPFAGGTLAGVVLLACLFFVIMWAILWVIFPVFVYLKMNELIRLLDKVESNTRPDHRVTSATE